jgi:cellulose synthase/poly-beta-1,6-N-acetylglucosamine synthase-like glycosyltransferase
MTAPAPVRVSIVVPSYNHARFLRRALDSALQQTYSELELVVVDDGSTDGSRELLRAYGADPRFRLYEQENRGADAAIARGLELARGEILFILNSDDAFPPLRVERLVAELGRHPESAAACSWIDIIDAEGRPLGRKEAWHNLPPWPQPFPGANLDALGRPELALLAGNFVATTSNLALRRSVLETLELLPLRYCHDWDLALQLARRGLRVVAEPLVSYRVHPANTLREGADAASGQARMRYEILWVVARHAPELLAEAIQSGCDGPDLRARFARSAAHFGCPEIAHALLAQSALGSPEAYRALLADDHPFRRAALAQLGSVESRAGSSTPG